MGACHGNRDVTVPCFDCQSGAHRHPSGCSRQIPRERTCSGSGGNPCWRNARNLKRVSSDLLRPPPGAAACGAWRRSALVDACGYPQNTLAEDQDLTIAIQRKSWKVCHDEDAVAWTEAPETLGALQCLWKHRSVLWERKPAGLGIGWGKRERTGRVSAGQSQGGDQACTA